MGWLAAVEEQRRCLSLKPARRLTSQEWLLLFAALDRLAVCRVEEKGQSFTFTQFYRRVVDRVYAPPFLTELLAMSEVNGPGVRLMQRYLEQVLAALGPLQRPATACVTVDRGTFVVVDYAVWKDRIQAQQVPKESRL
jgi:hypothetical protein